MDSHYRHMSNDNLDLGVDLAGIVVITVSIYFSLKCN